MTENLFDNFIKDKLSNHESYVPQNLWDKIVAEKEIKKKPLPFWKNGYFKGIILALIVTGLISSTIFISTNYSLVSNSTKNQIIKSTTNVIEATKTTNESTSKNSLISVDKNINNNKSPKDNKIGSSANEDNNERSITTENSKETSIAKINSIHSISKRALKSSLVKKEHTIPNRIINAPTAYNDNNGGDDENVSESKSLLSKEKATINSARSFAKTTKQMHHSATPNSENNALLASRDVKESNQKPNISESYKDNISTSIVENKFEKGNIISSDKNVLQLKDINKTLSSENKNTTTIHLPDTKRKGWYVELYASPDIDTKQINSNGLSNNYLQKQDSATKSFAGITAGFRISKTISNHFLIKSGIQFKESAERFRYLKQTDIKNVTVLTTRSYTDNSGATVYQTDSSVVQQSSVVVKTVFNTYKSVEIPLIGSWESNFKKLHWAVSGGAILNLATYYEGQTFDNTLNVVPLGATQTNGLFKSNANVSLYGSVSLLYNVGNSIDAFAEPYYRYGLSNSSNSSIGYNQRFNSAGINFGLRYKIPTLKSIK